MTGKRTEEQKMKTAQIKLANKLKQQQPVVETPVVVVPTPVAVDTDNLNENQLIALICGGIPGTYAIMSHIINEYNPEDEEEKEEKEVVFLKNIINNRIFGSKLYYVWKNNCKKNYDELIEHNFDQYDDAYFLDKPV